MRLLCSRIRASLRVAWLRARIAREAAFSIVLSLEAGCGSDWMRCAGSGFDAGKLVEWEMCGGESLLRVTFGGGVTLSHIRWEVWNGGVNRGLL